MRALLIFAIAATAALALLLALRTATGDPLSAIVIELLLLVTLAAWLSPAADAGRPTSRRGFG